MDIHSSARFRTALFLLAALLIISWPKQPALASGTVTNCLSWTGGLPGNDTLGELLPSGGTITFACDGTLNAESVNITNNVTIDGTGHTVTIDNFAAALNFVSFNLKNLSFNNASIAFESGGGTFTNVTIMNSDRPLVIFAGTVILNGGLFADNATIASGGAIINSGTLTITDTQFTNNTAISTDDQCLGCGYGGAIDNNGGILTLNHVTLQGNDASFEGAAVITRNDGDMTINNSTITGNGSMDWQASAIFGETASPGHYVRISDSQITNNTNGGITVVGAALNITNSQITGNTNVAEGAGILFAGEDDEDTFSISDSTIIQNSAGFPGGGIKIVYLSAPSNTITNTTISNNVGGGISINPDAGRPLEIIRSTISDNSSTKPGGGIQSGVDLYVVESSFVNNRANSGGGIYLNGTNHTLTLDRSLVYNNMASGGGNPGDGYGGGINLNNASLSVLNSTISGNTAANKGAGLYIQNTSSTRTYSILSSTFADNASSFGRSIYNEAINPKSVSVKNSLLSGVPGVSTQCFGAVMNGGNNLTTDNSCTGFKLVAVADIGLEALADNGGLSETQALNANSVAIDAIPAAQCGTLVDQRSMVRPFGNGCDIGAFESPFFISLPNAAPLRNYYTSSPITLTWSGVSGATEYEVVVADHPTFNMMLSFQQDSIPANMFYVTIPPLPVGTYYWRVRAKKSDGTYGVWSVVESFKVA